LNDINANGDDMARRRSSYNAQSGGGGWGKSRAEARVERLTWAFLVIIFAIPLILEDTPVPNGFVVLAGAVILLGSGFYQYSRRWKVSPITWIAGTLMLFLSILNFALDINRDFTGWALIIFAAVILFGLVTGET
jgi:hypothetical protein